MFINFFLNILIANRTQILQHPVEQSQAVETFLKPFSSCSPNNFLEISNINLGLG